MMKIIWSIKTKYSYFDELDRIDKFHTIKEIDKFINFVGEVILDLKTEALQVKASESIRVYSFVISKANHFIC